ncbi:MAG: S9 family peptidase [Acidobacteria bacterium]|nr:S9 family peptidase [Acidobacteriota bacterium]
MKRIRFFSFILVLALACFPIITGAEQTEYVQPPETIINDQVPQIPIDIQKKMEQYSNMKSAFIADWTPDGKSLIVTTRFGNTSQLYLVEKPNSKLIQLTDYEEPVTNASVCPTKGKNYFIFSKDVGGAEAYQYFKYDLTKREATMITDGKSRHMGLSFNNKGDKIAFVNNSRTGMLFDVYTMDPENPTDVKMVFEAKQPAYYLPTGWSKDDTKLLVIEYISANEVNTYMVDITTGTSEMIDPGCKDKCVFTMGDFSEDGKAVYGISDIGSEFKKIISYDLATKKITTITDDINWDVDGVVATKDKKTAVFTINENGITKIYKMDMATSKYEKLDVLPFGVLAGLALNEKTNRLAFSISGPKTNSDVFELDLNTKSVTRWTTSDTAGLDPSTFVEPIIVEFPTFDQVAGKPRIISAFYYKPAIASADKPVPVIINIHGGPEAQYQPKFSTTLGYWTNELGIAVISPNVRGSEGYGKSFMLLDNAEKREDSVKDIGALLSWIEKQPELDKNRVAVFGGSYGGYMVLASMIKFSDKIKCAVDIVGISSFVTFLKNTSPYRQDLRRAEYGDERVIGEFLESISPLTHANKIKGPLFVIQGKNDPRVPYTEAEQIVKTVRENGIPVWYQLATNEGHGFSKKDNRDFMNYSIIKFFQEYLIK